MNLWISGGGIACPVGYSRRAAFAAMAAGVPRLSALPYIDNDGQPITGGIVSALAPSMPYADRLVSLARAAIEDCVSSSEGLVCGETALVLLTANDPGRLDPGWDPRALAFEVAGEFDASFARGLGVVMPAGSAGIAAALQRARQLLAEGGAAGVLLCAADSLVNAAALDWLDRSRRLKTSSFSDGVIPGEAAACLWLTPQRRASAELQCRISGLGAAIEPATLLDDEPFRGDGMTNAVREALDVAGLPFAAVALRIADVGGESYEFEEQSLLVNRLLREPREQVPLWHPAEYIGTTGAAGSAVVCLWGAHALSQGRAGGNSVLACVSDVNGARVALVLTGRERQPELPEAGAPRWAI